VKSEETKDEAGLFHETIAAIITPPGEGGVAAVRVAGPDSLALLEKLFRPTSGDSSPSPFLMRHGHFVTVSGEQIDEVLAVYMPHGKSYTGLAQVEFFCHGGREVVRRIEACLFEAGARPAESGEFTRLAFLNGKIDLARAEAVAELIAANTRTSYEASREHLLGRYSEHIESLRKNLVEVIAEIEASIDFSEEEIEPAESVRLNKLLENTIEKINALLESYQGGRMVREGFRIVIGGRPNVGKSSLFNLLVRQERALVNPTPGTTRDYLDEWIDLEGFAVNIIDTAGFRKSGGSIEKQGQARAKDIIEKSNLLLWMYDLTDKNWKQKLKTDLCAQGGMTNMVVGNKLDVVSDSERTRLTIEKPSFLISCITGEGIDTLKAQMVNMIESCMPDLTSGLVVTSARHQNKLSDALADLTRAKERISNSEEPVLTAVDLRSAISSLDEITGRVYTEEILGQIFSRFCVGK
jgi:tRNA modification GTPase